mmetsp:Transcript_19595/g.45675  ORF Transcript_19595/g.45675 Transcript_19595/m.45675 type:complete len:245 (-) Transcript_19595:94-828(-)
MFSKAGTNLLACGLVLNTGDVPFRRFSSLPPLRDRSVREGLRLARPGPRLERGVAVPGDSVVVHRQVGQDGLQDLFLDDLVFGGGFSVEARADDAVPDLRITGRNHELDPAALLLLLAGAEDHSVTRKSHQLARLEVRQNQHLLADHLVDRVVGPKARGDAPGSGLLPEIDFLAVELVGLGMFPALLDHTDPDVELRDVEDHGGGLLLLLLLLLLPLLPSARSCWFRECSRCRGFGWLRSVCES